MPSWISVLQPPGEDLIQSGSRNDAELAKLRYGPCKLPTGYSGAHTTLNDRRKATHTGEYGPPSPF